MSLWVKRSTAETVRQSKGSEAVSRLAPLPFEERRGQVGMVSYGTWRRWRVLPYVLGGIFLGGYILESRSQPEENFATAVHLWLADRGVFPHDSIKALNPAFDEERSLMQWKTADRIYRVTGVEYSSEKQLKEYAAMRESAKFQKKLRKQQED